MKQENESTNNKADNLTKEMRKRKSRSYAGMNGLVYLLKLKIITFLQNEANKYVEVVLSYG